MMTLAILFHFLCAQHVSDINIYIYPSDINIYISINKIVNDIKLVFYSSTITTMHGPINIRFTTEHG